MSSNKTTNNKPYKFDKGKTALYKKGEIVCENYYPVNDGVYSQKGENCRPVPPRPVPDFAIPAICHTSMDCPRGYICRRNYFGQNICVWQEVITPEPEDMVEEITGMWCNLDGMWVPCGSDYEDPWDCHDHTTEEICTQSMGDDFYGCVWCPDVNIHCRNHTELYGNETLFNNCGTLYTEDEASAEEIGCTDPYSINYNSQADAQRNSSGFGCPPDKNCCLYEGAKLNFTRDTFSTIQFEAGGSYIIVFRNNLFPEGGLTGYTYFWDAFQSLGSMKHAPETIGGQFFVTDMNNANAESQNEIRNGAWDGSSSNCIPSEDLVNDQCSYQSWYHISTFTDINFISKYKYRVYKCGVNM